MRQLRGSRQSPTRITRVTQNVETEVSFVAGPGANLRYAYFRSSDSMASAIEGQDFLIFQQDDWGLAFVVCDGVGSSFCGNIAARVLGEGLLEFLWRIDPASASTPGALAESVGAFLRQLRTEGESQVKLYQIDDELPPLVRQALEQQRAYGSEAVFAAGRVDYPVEGQDEGHLLLCWMGDTQLHALDADGRVVDIGADWTNKDRWSTAHGVKGRVHAWIGSTQGIERLLAFSDGLSAYADRLSNLSDGELEELIYKQLRSASSDDVALIDVALKTPHYMGLDDPETDPGLPAPQMTPLADPAFGQPFELGWMWDKKAKHYLLEVGGSPAFDHATTHTVQEEIWQVEAPAQPGRLYYRVRAVARGGRMSRWSEPQPVRIAYPPPPAPDLQPIDDSMPGVPYSVAWSDVPHARVYVLEEADEADFNDPHPVYRGSATSWTVGIGGRAPGTFHYRVQAISDGGPGAWSAPRKARLRIPPPPAPHLASVAPGKRHGEYTLRWTDVPEADHYEVEETDQDGETQVFTTGDLAYSVRGQTEGEYTYRVRACAAHGHSGWSDAQRVTVGPREPADAPHARIEEPDQDGVLRVEWDEVERAETYLLEASLERNFRDVRSRSTSETWMEVRPTGPGEIFVRVRAENAGGPGPWSRPERAVVPPTAPAWLEAEVQGDSQTVKVRWATVPGDVTYQLELVITEDNFEESRALYQGSETEFRGDLPDDIDTCEFRVRAKMRQGSSLWTYSQAVDLPRPPQPPRMESPMVSPQNMVLLTWSASRGATHYLLEIGRDETFANVQSVRCDTPQFTFDPGGRWRYWFRVRACRGEMVGRPSQPVTMVMDRSDAPRLTPIRQVSPNALYTVTWTSVRGTQYYELQEATDPSFEEMERFRVFHPGLGYTFPGRPAGAYYYRVQAVDDQGRASDWSETLIVEIK